MNLATYRKHFAVLKGLATVAGADLDVDYFQVKYPDRYGVYGHYNTEKRRIYVKVYGNQSRKLILATLAHEVRHAQHHHQGLWADYYDSRYHQPDYVEKVLRGEALPPDPSIGDPAENDCNKFATEWMAIRGIPLDPKKKSHESWFRPYNTHHVFTNRIITEINIAKFRRKDPPKDLPKTELTL
jgi:hypothetical protein